MNKADPVSHNAYTLGITGGLATGKSSVARLFHERGVTVFSADEAARATLNASVLHQIAEAFGEDMLRPDGSLDRARLGARIFGDAAARALLNRITHPPILRLLRSQVESARADLPVGSLIAVEVPLLYETELSDWFDSVLVVSASETVQLARLMERSGLDEPEARRRISAQFPMSYKEASADYVVTNNGTPEQLAVAVNALLRRIETEHSVRSYAG